MTSFMVIIILYSIRVITIIIIDRRHAFIIVNLLIKAWGTKNIIFFKHSFPKLVALHIISIIDIQGIHTNNIAIMLIIQIFSAKHFIDFFFEHFGTIFLSIVLTKDIKKVKRMRQTQFHFFVVLFYKLTSAK